jgi:plastocyanin
MIKRFRIKATLLAAVLAVTSQVAQVSPAQAGGGCHSAATNGTGTTVEMKDMCFTPTVLRVRPGDSVTFVNRDDMQHTVTGTSELFGSYTGLAPQQSATYTFAKSGVYAYSCIFHPGMTGAVMVGDGSGPGLAAGVENVAVTRVKATAAAARPAPPAAPEPPWAWLIAAALLIGGGLGYVFSQRVQGQDGR